MMIRLLLPTSVLLMFVASGCSGTGETVQPTVVVTATATVTATAQPAPIESTEESFDTGEAESGSGSVTVEDGVGMNYQDAQDLWRSQGLVVMPAEDATGANRIPILDSGWVVVSQDPPAGSAAADGDAITATIKKYTDD